MNLGPLPLTLSISSNASSIEPTDTRCFTPVLYREPKPKLRWELHFAAIGKGLSSCKNQCIQARACNRDSSAAMFHAIPRCSRLWFRWVRHSWSASPGIWTESFYPTLGLGPILSRRHSQGSPLTWGSSLAHRLSLRCMDGRVFVQLELKVVRQFLGWGRSATSLSCQSVGFGLKGAKNRLLNTRWNGWPAGLSQILATRRSFVCPFLRYGVKLRGALLSPMARWVEGLATTKELETVALGYPASQHGFHRLFQPQSKPSRLW